MPTMNELTAARTKATELTSTAGDYVAGKGEIESILKQKLTDAYKANEDLVKPLDTATQNYYQAPAVAREKYQGIFNPFTREKLVSQYTGNEAIPMLGYSNLYGQRQGSIADTINAGVGAYNTQATQATNQANTAQNSYDQMWKEYQFQEEQKLEQQKLAQKDAFDPLSMLTKLKNFDPNSAMVTSGQNADTVLKNIDNITKASDSDLSVAAKIASGSGGNALGSLTSNYYKIFASPTQIALAEDLVNARNVLRLRFTGAAFSESERPDYAFLTGQDPVLVFKDPKIVKDTFAKLKPQFEVMSKSGQNPYQEKINLLNKLYMGMDEESSPGISKEVYVQNIKTGEFGAIDEKEFDPNLYRRF